MKWFFLKKMRKISKNRDLADKDGILLKLFAYLSKLFFVMKATCKTLCLEFCVLVFSGGVKNRNISQKWVMSSINENFELVKPLDQKLGVFLLLVWLLIKEKNTFYIARIVLLQKIDLQAVNTVCF